MKKNLNRNYIINFQFCTSGGGYSRGGDLSSCSYLNIDGAYESKAIHLSEFISRAVNESS
jgi:hypothetical protein